MHHRGVVLLHLPLAAFATVTPMAFDPVADAGDLTVNVVVVDAPGARVTVPDANDAVHVAASGTSPVRWNVAVGHVGPPFSVMVAV